MSAASIMHSGSRMVRGCQEPRAYRTGFHEHRFVRNADFKESRRKMRLRTPPHQHIASTSRVECGWMSCSLCLPSCAAATSKARRLSEDQLTSAASIRHSGSRVVRGCWEPRAYRTGFHEPRFVRNAHVKPQKDFEGLLAMCINT